MNKCIDLLRDAQLFSTLHPYSNYLKNEVDKAVLEKTAFTCYGIPYDFKRILFNLKITPAILQRIIAMILSSVKWQFALPHLEDIIIFSMTAVEYIARCKMVLSFS